jgi:hypothetical protein
MNFREVLVGQSDIHAAARAGHTPIDLLDLTWGQ